MQADAPRACRFGRRWYLNNESWHPSVPPFGEMKCILCWCVVSVPAWGSTRGQEGSTGVAARPPWCSVPLSAPQSGETHCQRQECPPSACASPATRDNPCCAKCRGECSAHTQAPLPKLSVAAPPPPSFLGAEPELAQPPHVPSWHPLCPSLSPAFPFSPGCPVRCTGEGPRCQGGVTEPLSSDSCPEWGKHTATLGGQGGPHYLLPLPVQGRGHRGAQWGAHGQAPSLGTHLSTTARPGPPYPLVPVGSGQAHRGWGTHCPATPSPLAGGHCAMLYIV